jgi:hypothetical protein
MEARLRPARSVSNESLNRHIKEIVLAVNPEKIFLLSASYHYQVTENIFIPNPLEEIKESQYQVLVLIHGETKKSLAGLEIVIRTKLMNHGNLQVHLMDIHVFNKQVEQGDEWSGFILLNALLCYDRENIRLSDPYIY